MSVTYDFSGKVALVTGAASGMGYATAKAFAAAGGTADSFCRPANLVLSVLIRNPP